MFLLTNRTGVVDRIVVCTCPAFILHSAESISTVLNCYQPPQPREEHSWGRLTAEDAMQQFIRDAVSHTGVMCKL